MINSTESNMDRVGHILGRLVQIYSDLGGSQEDLDYILEMMKGPENLLDAHVHELIREICVIIDNKACPVGGEGRFYKPFDSLYQELCGYMEFGIQKLSESQGVEYEAVEGGLNLIIVQEEGVEISEENILDIKEACHTAWGREFGNQKGVVLLSLEGSENGNIIGGKCTGLSGGSTRIQINLNAGIGQNFHVFSRSQIILAAAHEIMHVVQRLRPGYIEPTYMSHPGNKIAVDIELGDIKRSELSSDDLEKLIEYGKLYSTDPDEIEADSFAASYLKAKGLEHRGLEGNLLGPSLVVHESWLVLSDLSKDMDWGDSGSTLWVMASNALESTLDKGPAIFGKLIGE